MSNEEIFNFPVFGVRQSMSKIGSKLDFDSLNMNQSKKINNHIKTGKNKNNKLTKKDQLIIINECMKIISKDPEVEKFPIDSFNRIFGNEKHTRSAEDEELWDEKKIKEMR